MANHDERMKGLGRDFSYPDARFLLEKGTHPLQKLPRKRRRALTKTVNQRLRRLKPVLKAISDDGAGFPIDQTIRAQVAEINNRCLTHGTEVMPMSFNVMEAFFVPEKFEGSTPIFKLRDERDHMFSLSDFFDFLTSSDGPSNPVLEAMRVPEGVIHSYTPTGNIEELTFLYGDSTAFAIGGFAFIRYGTEISWLLLGGPRVTDAELEATRNLSTSSRSSGDPRKKFFDQKCPKGEERPLVMEGTTNVWRTLVFGRLVADSGKHLVRYRAREYETSFDTVTDDPCIFDAVPEADVDAVAKRALDTFDEEGVLFNIAEGLCALPSYFDFKIRLVREINRETRLSRKLSRGTKSGTGRRARSEQKRFRKVAALEIINPASPPSLREYRPPQYQVEVEGFWRRLANEAMGRGFNGEAVQGRTWVKAHLRWRDRPPRAKTIYVKSLVSVAKATAAALASSKQTLQSVGLSLPADPPESTALKAGYLYVMRCPLMDGDIYKVGFTVKTPKERAEELSRATGVPLAYIVVHSWHHENAREQEKLAHAALADYRVTPKREFFKAPFEELRERIERAISLASK
jgi:hypothetical protein